ncbi:MAG: cytochrome c [Vicinamibacteria bacterium]
MRSPSLALAAVVMLLGAACRQDMHNQPKAKPQSKSAFFADGRTARLPVEGTVAQGDLRDDDGLYKGKVDGKFVTTFPFAIDATILERGHERYNIFCSPCHGQTGLGNGMVVQRGHKIPPSHHIERLRNEAPGYWFDVISNGFGVMYGYAAQIPVKDRWAIAAYVKALQLSRLATLEQIPEADREAVLAGRQVARGAQNSHEGAAESEGAAMAAVHKKESEGRH